MLYQVQVGSVPIYRQIVQRITHQVAAGYISAGTLLPSVRQVATELAINPMTVSKAYGLLVEKGIVSRNRGGNLAVSAEPMSETERINVLRPFVAYSVEVANDLGLGRNAVIALI